MPNSLLAGKIQGISSIWGSIARQWQLKAPLNQYLTSQFPTHLNREFFGPYRELNRTIREILKFLEIFALIRESRSRRLFWGLCPAENPIVPTDLKRCREGERDAARCSKSPKPISSSSLVRVKAPQACRKSLAELVDA